MLPVALCSVAVTALLLAEFNGWSLPKALAKVTASGAFLWLALANGALASVPGTLILIALALCLIGDALLLPAGRTRFFLFGIGAFLLAHLVYGGAFVFAGLDKGTLAVAILVALPAGAAIVRWLKPHVGGNLKAPVFAYVVALLAMVATAAGASGAGAPISVAVGAGGFALSDLAVARDRFVRKSFVNRAWGLPTYYAAQLVLAGSVSAWA